MNSAIILLVMVFPCLSVARSVSEKTSERVTYVVPSMTDDYGSGSSLRVDWYSPGGLDRIGGFVGHPNGLARGDRVLVRFNIAAYLLRPLNAISIRSARVCFTVAAFAGSAKVRRLEVEHFNYDPWRLGGNDLVTSEAQRVGEITVKSADHGRSFSLDVTKFLAADIAAGNKYCAFRVRDVQAEAEGNPTLQPCGVVLFHQSRGLPRLKIKEEK